jgi:hypothetical protein
MAPILEHRLVADIWNPLVFSTADLTAQHRGFQYIDVIGRLKRGGTTLRQARAEFDSIAARLRQQYRYRSPSPFEPVYAQTTIERCGQINWIDELRLRSSALPWAGAAWHGKVGVVRWPERG